MLNFKKGYFELGLDVGGKAVAKAFKCHMNFMRSPQTLVKW